MDRQIQDESVRAVSGAMAIGAGQVAILLVALATTILMPRVFGAEDFGRWVLYRSVISIAMVLCISGSGELLGRFYVAERAGGRDADALRLFKLNFAGRMVLAGAGALACGLLLGRSAHLAAGPAAGALSAASVLLLVAGMLFQAVPYCERRMRRVAVLNFLAAALVPALVLAARAAGGFQLVPWACALGDAAYAAAAFGLARPFLRRASGWPPAARWPEYARFAGSTGFSNAMLGVYGNLPPYLMAQAGMPVAQIAFMGLATRIGDMVRTTLVSMGGSLFPSITWILEREGLERARRWQGLATRLGAVLALAAAGIFAVAGGGLVQWIWGADFAGAVPVIGLGLYAVVFLWIGFQHGWLGMLLKTGLPFAIGSLALVLAFAALFRAGGAGGDALGVARLQLVCAAGFMLLVVACLRIGWRQGLPIGRLAVPAVVAAGAAPFLFREPLGLAASLLAVALWTALFVTAAFLSRSITALEIVEVARRLRGRSNGGAG